MDWQLQSYVAILFLNSLISLIVAYFVLRLRDKPGGLPLGLLMLAVAEWSLALAFEATATTIPAKVLWSKIEYLGITSAPVFLLLFALEFTHREKWLKRRYVILYWIIPLISLTLAFTNERHLMIWTSFTPIPGSNLITYGHGTWFWIMVTYDYLVLSTATILLLRAAFRLRHIHRRQAIMLFVGMFPPWLMNVLYVFDLGPPGWDLTPIGFALTGLLLTWSLARLQLLDLSPVARDKVIESMHDGMLVLDAQNRIVDINPAAQKLIGVDGEPAIGQQAETILAKWTSLEDRHQDAMEAQGEVFVDGAGYIEWRAFPLHGQGRRPCGQLIILRDVTERKRAGEQIKRRGEELEALQEISLAITAQLELNQVLHNVVEQGCRLLKVKSGGIHLVDETSGGLQMVVSYGYTRDYTGTRLSPGEGIAGKVLQSGAPMTVNDYSHWEGRSPDWEAESITTVLSMPLKHSDQVIGVLNFSETGRARRFDDHDVWLATLFASHAAVAIENARLYQAEQAAHESADTLREVSRAVGSTLELDDVLSLVLRQAKRVLTYDTASILLFDDGEPAMAAVSGYEDEDLVKTEATLRLADSPILQAMARDHRSVVIADTREDERWIRVPGAENIRAWIGAPLLVRDEMIGALMLDSTQPGFYTTADVAIAQALANQTAVAIANAQLYQAELRGREVAEALQETARVVNASLNLDKVLPLILEQLAQVIQYDSSAVLLLNEGRFKVTTGRGFPNLEAALRLSFSADEDNLSSAVMRARRPLIIEDVQADSRWQPDAEITHIHGWIGAPLIVRDQVIGVLTVDSRQPGAYSEEDGQLVFSFADQAAVAIENARLYEQAQHHLESLTNLNRASQIVTSFLDVNEVLEQIVELAEPVVHSDYTSIVLLGEEGEPVLVFGDLQRVSRGTGGVRSNGVTHHVLDSGQPVVVDTISDEGVTSPQLRQPDGELMKANPNVVSAGVRSFAAVPIQAKGKTMGVLFVHSRQPHAFHGQLPLLIAFANQAAVAIENARLFEAERQQRAQAEALREIGIIISSALDLDEVLKRLLEQVEHIVPSDSSNVMLIENGRVRIAHQRGYERFGVADEVARTTFEVQQTANLRRMMETGEAHVVPDTMADPDWVTAKAAAHVRSHAGAPIIVDGKVVGFFSLDKTQAEFYQQEHTERLDIFARQAAVAIKNARLFEEVQEHAARLEKTSRDLDLVHQVSQMVNSSLHLTRILETTVEQMVAVFEADHSGILLFDQTQTHGQVVAEYPSTGATTEQFPVQGYLAAERIIADREPLVIEDVWNDPLMAAVQEAMHRLDFRSMLIVPLIVKEKVVGSIGLDAVGRQRRFNAEEVALAQTIANQAAIAIDNAWLYEQAQQEIAERKRAQEALDQKLIALTQPVGKVGELKLTDIIDVGILQELQDGFAVSYDIASLIFDDAGKAVTEPSNFSDFCRIIRATKRGSERCEISDAGLSRLVADGSPAIAPCRNFEAIQDGAVPIFIGDRRVATWAIGQKVISEIPENKIRSYAEEIGADPDQLVAAGKKLNVGSKEQFERAVSLLETVASNISLLGLQNIQQAREITERKRAEEALKRRATQLATVSEVGRQITSLLEPDPLLDHIVNLIRGAFKYRYVSILLIDPTTGELALRAGAGYNLETAKALRLKVGEDGICGWVAASGEPLLVGDVSQEPRHYSVEALLDTRSELAVPIQVKSQVIGVLDVQSAEPGAFDKDDLFTLNTLADQVAVAMENAGLYQELHNYAEQLEQRVQERTAQLQAQYARLDAILRSSSDGIVVTDAGGEIIQTNPVAQTWLAQTLSPENATRLREAVRNLARRAEERPEAVLELKGLHLELRVSPIAEPGMEEAAAVVAIHDVSHLKALDRVKSRFVTNVSHELRTPITTIKLYADLMRRRPERWKEYLDTLEQEADRQARLVEDILQISRIDAGRLEMQPRPASLDELAEMAMASHQVLAQDRGLTLEHRSTELRPVTLVDPKRLMQVLNNLLQNAIYYTPKGGKVTVSTGQEESEERVWATVTVADTGMGIPEKELPYIFDRFFRGDEPRVMQISGTGLGLAITNEIVELHGGKITVESEEGAGSTFTVWLPLAGGRRSEG